MNIKNVSCIPALTMANLSIYEMAIIYAFSTFYLKIEENNSATMQLLLTFHFFHMHNTFYEGCVNN